MVTKFMYPEDRLYNIKNDMSYFYTGCLPDGHQVLMGVQMPKAVMLIFDTSGNYVCTYIRDFSDIFLSEVDKYKIISRLHTKEIPEWQEEIGYLPGTIKIKRFFLQDKWIGIKEAPEHFLDESLSTYYTESEIEEIKESFQQWYQEKAFVLWFSQDYYMNEEGDVESS